MEKININSIKLAYSRRGRGAPLILIHGYPLDHSIWEDVAAILANDFDLIIPDIRGFGSSSTINEPYTIKDISADIAGLMDQLGIKQASLVGHSMGGYVALAFARQYPGRISSLALVSSQAAADPADRKEGRYKTAEDVAQKGVGIVADAMAPKMSSDSRIQTIVHKLMEQQSKSGVIGALKAMAERDDSGPYLSGFKFPIVLIHGDADLLIPIDRAREIKSILPEAKLLELAGAGHVPMMEQPQATAEALRLLK